MKTTALMLLVALLVIGCHKEQPKPERYQMASLTWFNGAKTGTLGVCGDPPKEFTVTSLEDCANKAGQYGWQFQRSEKSSVETTWYFQRRITDDGKNGNIVLLCLPPE